MKKSIEHVYQLASKANLFNFIKKLVLCEKIDKRAKNFTM